MASKKVTDDDIIKFLNGELNTKKTDQISSLMNIDKNLRLKIESIQDLNQTVNLAAEKAYPIPKDFQKLIEEIVTPKVSIKKKITNWLESFSLFGLISGSAFTGGAFASFCLIVFISINNPILISQNSDTAVFRGNNQLGNKKVPNSWIVENHIIFAISYSSKEKPIDTKENVEVNLGDAIIFTIIPYKSKIIDIIYLSNDGKSIKLYSKLSIKKGKTFVSKELLIGEPAGIDKIQVLENGNLILEKKILVIK